MIKTARPAWFIAAVRTLSQYVISLALGVPAVTDGLGWLAENLGVTVTRDHLVTAAVGVVLTATAAITNYVDKRFPRVGRIVSQIISLWQSNSGAHYLEEAVDEGEAVLVVDDEGNPETGVDGDPDPERHDLELRRMQLAAVPAAGDVTVPGESPVHVADVGSGSGEGCVVVPPASVPGVGPRWHDPRVCPETA